MVPEAHTLDVFNFISTSPTQEELQTNNDYKMRQSSTEIQHQNQIKVRILLLYLGKLRENIVAFVVLRQFNPDCCLSSHRNPLILAPLQRSAIIDQSSTTDVVVFLDTNRDSKLCNQRYLDSCR